MAAAALDRYRRKENLAMVAQVEQRLERLRIRGERRFAPTMTGTGP